jgi:hypothetical protein
MAVFQNAGSKSQVWKEELRPVKALDACPGINFFDPEKLAGTLAFDAKLLESLGYC